MKSRALVCGAAAVLLLGLAGCKRPRWAAPAGKAAKEKDPGLSVEIKGPRFVVQDRFGVPVMIATSKSSGGQISQGTDQDGPITFTDPDCMLYRNGKEDMRLTAPTAVWRDGKLFAGSGAHVEMVDGSLKADAQRAVWDKKAVTMDHATAALSKDGQLQVRLSAPEATIREDQL